MKAAEMETLIEKNSRKDDGTETEIMIKENVRNCDGMETA
jgi:hypothetical protein